MSSAPPMSHVYSAQVIYGGMMGRPSPALAEPATYPICAKRSDAFSQHEIPAREEISVIGIIKKSESESECLQDHKSGRCWRRWGLPLYFSKPG